MAHVDDIRCTVIYKTHDGSWYPLLTSEYLCVSAFRYQDVLSIAVNALEIPYSRFVISHRLSDAIEVVYIIAKSTAPRNRRSLSGPQPYLFADRVYARRPGLKLSRLMSGPSIVRLAARCRLSRHLGAEFAERIGSAQVVSWGGVVIVRSQALTSC